jgi:hypothetical protein
MIRRGFWLVAGAVLGVTGYRKATQLARTLTGAQAAGGTRQLPATGAGLNGAPRAAGPRAAARSGGGAPSAVARAVSAAGFVREMRAGMAEYWDLRRGEQDRGTGGRTLGSQGDSRGYRPDAAATRSAGAAPGGAAPGGAAQAGDQGRREP